MKVKSTKSWHKLPCAHSQFFDRESDGSFGECASWHGYDRSVKITFSGDIDEHGWIVPFGELKDVKEFIEYYFDHTAVMPANDPRKDQIITFNESFTNLPPMFKLRVLPYGVSMEMSALFIWEHVNPYIMSITNGRCYVESVECSEHDSNSAFIECTLTEANFQWIGYKNKLLPLVPLWEYTPPQTLKYFNKIDSVI